MLLASISHKPGVNIFITYPVNPVAADEKITSTYATCVVKMGPIVNFLDKISWIEKVRFEPLLLFSISHKQGVNISIGLSVIMIGTKDIDKIKVH